jgi:hypothetical protein
LNEIENLKKGNFDWLLLSLISKKIRFTKPKNIQAEQVRWWMLLQRLDWKDQVAYVNNLSKIKEDM